MKLRCICFTVILLVSLAACTRSPDSSKSDDAPYHIEITNSDTFPADGTLNIAVCEKDSGILGSGLARLAIQAINNKNWDQSATGTLSPISYLHKNSIPVYQTKYDVYDYFVTLYTDEKVALEDANNPEYTKAFDIDTWADFPNSDTPSSGCPTMHVHAFETSDVWERFGICPFNKIIVTAYYDGKKIDQVSAKCTVQNTNDQITGHTVDSAPTKIETSDLDLLGQITFINSYGEMYRMGSKGEITKLFTVQSAGGPLTCSSDGSKLAFYYSIHSLSGILVTDDAGEILLDINPYQDAQNASSRFNAWYASISPDGSKLALCDTDDQALYIYNLSGNLSKLADVEGGCYYPAGEWTPDSKSIVFGREGISFTEQMELYIVNIDNGIVRKLTYSPDGYSLFMGWLPGREKIITLTRSSQEEGYYVIDLNRETRTTFENSDYPFIELPNYIGGGYGPLRLSPDGTQYIDNQLYLVNLGSGNKQKITGIDGSYCWHQTTSIPNVQDPPIITVEPGQSPTNETYPVQNTYYPIEGCAASTLHKGDRVTLSAGTDYVSIRSAPDTHPKNKIGRINPGESVQIIGGPECNYGWLLWKIRTENGLEGWVPETDGNEFWLEVSK